MVHVVPYVSVLSFKDNRLITDIKKPLQLDTVTVSHPKQTKDLILDIPDGLS